MSISSLLTGWTVPSKHNEDHPHKYSITGDILAFKQCKRQYGYFKVRGFSSATATDRYFGILMHDVLDRINRDYQLTSTLPDHTEIKVLVAEAHDRLYRSGIRSYDPRTQQERAAKLIDRFVQLIGSQFFPNIRETEYRLERALQTHTSRDYILTGVVDVLSGAVSHALGLHFSTEPDDIEIWDYKSGTIPDKGSRELRDYEYQMRVYAELYQQQNGVYPSRSVLVFVGELDDDTRWTVAKADPTMFPSLIYVVHPHPSHIQTAMDDFHQTVEDIETERTKSYHLQWEAPTHSVKQQTCEACDLRFNCTNYATGAKRRSDPL